MTKTINVGTINASMGTSNIAWNKNNLVSNLAVSNNHIHSFSYNELNPYLKEKIDSFPVLETELSLVDQKKLIDADISNILLIKNLSSEIKDYACEMDGFLLYLYKRIDELESQYIERHIIKYPNSIQYLYANRPNDYDFNYTEEDILYQLIAVKNSGSAIRFIVKPCHQVMEQSIISSYYSINYMTNPPRDIQILAIRQGNEDGSDLYWLRNLQLTNEIFANNDILLDLPDDIVQTYFKKYQYSIYEGDTKDVVDDIFSSSNDTLSQFIYENLNYESYYGMIHGKIDLNFIKQDDRLYRLYKLTMMELKLKK